MPRRGKKIRDKKLTHSNKRIKEPNTKITGSDTNKYPAFNLTYLAKGYGLDECEPKEKLALLDTFRKLCSLTWGQIRQSGRKGSGSEIIPQNQLNIPLPKNITPEQNILAFRFSGRAPMLGYKDGLTLYIIAIDRVFTAYDHGS